jgi:hypothetical protein
MESSWGGCFGPQEALPSSHFAAYLRFPEKCAFFENLSRILLQTGPGKRMEGC